MTDQPSKESLERARKFMSYLKGGYPIRHFDKMIIDLALEFDAIAKERDAALIRANSGSELIKLRQHNAALVSALREVRDMIFNLPSGVDENASEDDRSPQDASAHVGGLIVQRINAALAPYAPAEEKEKP